jgi:SNF2 family DNA or RNA helicase
LLKEWDKFFAGASEERSNSTVKRESAIAKAPFTAQYCLDLLESGSSECLVVFSDHPDAAKIICDLLVKKDFKAVCAHGVASTDTRAKWVEDFQNGLLDVIVGTIGAFNTGYNLVRSKDVVFNDQSWVGTKNTQAYKRVHRLGQVNPVLVHRVFGSPQDEKISNLVEEKARVINQLDNIIAE